MQSDVQPGRGLSDGVIDFFLRYSFMCIVIAMSLCAFSTIYRALLSTSFDKSIFLSSLTYQGIRNALVVEQTRGKKYIGRFTDVQMEL